MLKYLPQVAAGRTFLRRTLFMLLIFFFFGGEMPGAVEPPARAMIVQAEPSEVAATIVAALGELVTHQLNLLNATLDTFTESQQSPTFRLIAASVRQFAPLSQVSARTFGATI